MQLQLTVVPDVFCKLPAEGHPDLMYYQCESVTKTIRTPWSFLEYVYFACEDNSCEPYQQKPLQQIKNLLLAIAYLYTKKSTLSLDESIFAANKITDILCEYFDWFNYINIYPNNNDEIRERFQAISAYCHDNFRRKVTIAELAKTVHINENYLSQFIRKSPYGSFSNMIGYFRCFHAQYLLLTTELPVMDIANRCGFSDIHYTFGELTIVTFLTFLPSVGLFGIYL